MLTWAEEVTMSILVLGGTGFIGTRVIRRLAARGEEVACMDINPGAQKFGKICIEILMRL